MDQLFYTRGAIASDDLISTIVTAHNGWARAVLSQSFGMPKKIQDALFAGEATWAIPNKNTIIITLKD